MPQYVCYIYIYYVEWGEVSPAAGASRIFETNRNNSMQDNR